MSCLLVLVRFRAERRHRRGYAIIMKIHRTKKIRVPVVGMDLRPVSEVSRSSTADRPSLANLALSVLAKGMCPKLHSNLPASGPIFQLWTDAIEDTKAGCFIGRPDVLRLPFDASFGWRVSSLHGDKNRYAAQQDWPTKDILVLLLRSIKRVSKFIEHDQTGLCWVSSRGMIFSIVACSFRGTCSWT